MFTLSFAIRQTAALLCAGTLAWDYFRDPAVIGNFSVWALAIHFTYFQLPFKSRAIPFMHSTSFIGACLVPVMYIFLSYWSPSLEAKHMEVWEVSSNTVLIRAVLVHLCPQLFHMLDLSINLNSLINAYRPKSKKLMYIWAFCSFPVLGLTFELLFPESEETSELVGISRDDFMRQNNYMCLVGLVVSFAMLYGLVLRSAYQSTSRNSINILHSNNGTGTLFPKDSVHDLAAYQDLDDTACMADVHAHRD